MSQMLSIEISYVNEGSGMIGVTVPNASASAPT
jgi:hypothetical protein